MDTSPILYYFGEFELDPVDKVLSNHGRPVPLTRACGANSRSALPRRDPVELRCHNEVVLV